MNFLLSHLDCLFRRTVGYWAMSTASIFIVISLQRTRDTTECAVYRYWQTVAWQFQEILLDLCTNDRWRDGAVTQDKLVGIHYFYVCIYRFQNVFLRCPTPRLHCFLSFHWPSFRFLSFMTFLIPSIQFFFGLPRALFCFGIHFNTILGNLPSAILWIWPYHVSKRVYIIYTYIICIYSK